MKSDLKTVTNYTIGIFLSCILALFATCILILAADHSGFDSIGYIEGQPEALFLSPDTIPEISKQPVYGSKQYDAIQVKINDSSFQHWTGPVGFTIEPATDSLYRVAFGAYDDSIANVENIEVYNEYMRQQDSIEDKRRKRSKPVKVKPKIE